MFEEDKVKILLTVIAINPIPIAQQFIVLATFYIVNIFQIISNIPNIDESYIKTRSLK